MFYIILSFGVFFDLLTKYFAYTYLQNKINLIGDFFYLELFKNPGIAFSIKVPGFILKILTISLIVGIYIYYKKERIQIKNKLGFDISFGLILSGAIGNGIERVFRSEVVDFIGVKYFSVFNLADSFIFIGVIIYLILVNKKVL